MKDINSITKFKNPPVIIGGMVMDLRGYPLDKLKLYTSNPGKLKQTPGGVGRNIAENLIRLGIDPLFISVVGNDPLGNFLLNHAGKIGLNLQGITQLSKETTALYLAILDEVGDLQTAIADMSIFEKIDPELIMTFSEDIVKAPMVIVDTNLPVETLQVISVFCFNNKIPLWVEPVSINKSKKILNLLKYITCISPNREELEALTGIKLNSSQDIEQAGQLLINQGLKYLLITLGKDGVIFGSKKGFLHYPAIPTVVEDVTGAGDAFIAGTVYGLLKGFNFDRAIPYGLITAMFTIQCTDTVCSYLNPELINKYVLEVYGNE